MTSVDRSNYHANPEKYSDSPDLIGFNATISAPHMHAFALESMLPYLKPDSRVLDVGSGSGYLSACIASLLGENGVVVGIDHIPGLVEQSMKNVRRDGKEEWLKSGKLQLLIGDGYQGYEKLKPYDVIHVGAAAKEIPKALVDQLALGGILIIPVGHYQQFMTLITKDQDGKLREKKSLAVRYVPLTSADEQLRE